MSFSVTTQSKASEQPSQGLTTSVEKVNEIDFTLNADGSVATSIYKDITGATLFTLTFNYNDAGDVTSIVRS